MRAALYVRVSRADQSPGLQADETRAFSKARGWTLVETYADLGQSGAKSSRPALNRLMADARKRAFDVVVVWKTDRLARSLSHLVSVMAELAALGIDFVSVTEPFDTSTPHGKMLFSIMGALSEFERDLLIERTRAGLQAARRRGARIGRPRVNVDLHRALTLRAGGISVRAIARDLGIGATTVRRALEAHDRGAPQPGAVGAHPANGKQP